MHTSNLSGSPTQGKVPEVKIEALQTASSIVVALESQQHRDGFQDLIKPMMNVLSQMIGDGQVEENRITMIHDD